MMTLFAPIIWLTLLGAPAPKETPNPATPLLASELKVALSGDHKADAVTVWIEKDGDFRTFEMRVHGAVSRGSYFAADSEGPPEVGPISLDARLPGKQLDLFWYDGPSWCTHRYLRYSNGRLFTLGEFGSNHCMSHPKILGEGQVSMGTWMGFWQQVDLYRLNREGTKLEWVKTPEYVVNIPTVLTGPTKIFSDKNCSQELRVASAGEHVTIATWNASTDCYHLGQDPLENGWVRVEATSFRNLGWAD